MIKAKIHFLEERYKEALKSAKKALALAPDSTLVCEALAHIYTGLKNWKESLAYVSRLIQKNRSSVTGYWVRVRINTAQKAFREALEDIERIMKLTDQKIEKAYFWPLKGDIFCEMAGVNLTDISTEVFKGPSKKDLLEKAMESYQKSLRLFPSPRACSRIGNLYVLEKNYPQAEEAYNKAKKISPLEIFKLYNALGAVQNYQEKFDEALEFSKDKDPRIYRNIAVIYHKKRDFFQAERYYTEFLKTKRKIPKTILSAVYYERALVRFKDGYPSGALSDLKEAIALNPRNDQARQLRDQIQGKPLPSPFRQALSLAQRGRLGQAIEIFTDIVLKSPRHWTAYLNRGVCYIKRGKNPEALRDFETVLSIKPDFPAAVKYKAACYQRMGDHKKAVMEYQRFLQLNPQAPDNGRIWDYIRQHSPK